MPAMCAVSGKTYKNTVKRSHSMRGTIVKRKANLQRILVGNKKIKICTKVLRTMKKNPMKQWKTIFA
jgi:ribosomal protein L28